MERNFSMRCMTVAFLLFTFVFTANAQQRRTSVRKTSSRTTTALKADLDDKRVSEADRKAIIALFKGVSPTKYKLQFYNGERKRASKYGRLRYQMADLKQVQRLKNPVGEKGWIVFVVEGDDVIYVLAVGSDKTKEVLGAQRAKRLDAIMAKYR